MCDKAVIDHIKKSKNTIKDYNNDGQIRLVH